MPKGTGHFTDEIYITDLQTELPIELLNPSASVDQFLFACKEGVTFRANLNRYVLLCRACFDNFAASTPDFGLLVVRMDTFLHYVHLFHEFSFQNARFIVA